MMASTKSTFAVFLIFSSLAIASAIAIGGVSEDISSSQEMPLDPAIDYRRAVMILRRALAQHSEAQDPTALMAVRKRTCYFNAGLSHGCDYKELLRALDETNYWNSDLTPGKRRKRSLYRNQNVAELHKTGAPAVHLN